jgi:hypothetical protein
MEMIAACREIGRLQGYYPDQSRQGGHQRSSTDGGRRIEELADAELAALAQQA